MHFLMLNIAYAICNIKKRICDISHMRYVTLQNAYTIYCNCDMGDSMKMGNTFWPNLAMKT